MIFAPIYLGKRARERREIMVTTGKANCNYEVLNPWAEGDPVQWKGINPRLTDLAGKKIGLLRNSKRTAEPSLKIVADRLKKKYPTIEFSWFSNLKPNEMSIAQDIKDDFEEWVKKVDAVIASYGD
jgi:hypothetical protein